MPWPLASKPKVVGGAGDVDAKIAADAASATVNVARRINCSRNISCGISESSSPRFSSNISSCTSNISNRSRNSSTRGTGHDISHSNPHSIQGDGVLRCGSFVRSRKRKKVDSRPFILPRRLHDEIT